MISDEPEGYRLRRYELLRLAASKQIEPSARAIANATGLRYDTLREAMNGKPISRSDIVIKLTRYFDATVEELWDAVALAA